MSQKCLHERSNDAEEVLSRTRLEDHRLLLSDLWKLNVVAGNDTATLYLCVSWGHLVHSGPREDRGQSTCTT